MLSLHVYFEKQSKKKEDLLGAQCPVLTPVSYTMVILVYVSFIRQLIIKLGISRPIFSINNHKM